MIIGYVRGNYLQRQLDELTHYGVDRLFREVTPMVDIFEDSTSQFQQMIDFSEPEDEIIVTSLSIISRDYTQLFKLVSVLDAKRVHLIVLNLDNESNDELKSMLRWVEKNDRLLHPRVIRIGKQKDKKTTYTLTSKDPEAKQMYRSIVGMLLRKQKMKEIAASNGVPLEAVFHIKKEMDKVKLALFLMVVFFATIVGIKIAEQITDSFWLQLVISLVASALIFFNTLSDSEIT